MGKRIAGIIVGAIVVVVVRGALSPSVNQQIISACEQINKDCPKACDAATRLDSCTPGEMCITYNYTVTVDLKKVPAAKLKEAMDAVQTEVTNGVKTNSQTKQLIDRGVTMCYHYQDDKGKLLKEFDVKP